MNKRILFVDDEVNVLSSHKRSLRKDYEVHVQSKPVEAIEFVKNSEDFSVVISDLKMPEMDGITMLSRIKQVKPDTIRILLTGYADLKNAINAVNEGAVFRFLTKPCDIASLKHAIDEGINQHRLINAEKELLNKTLNGSIKVLVDILAAANPAAFSQALRLRKYTKIISESLNVKDTWEIEIAALLSQIGLVAIPEEIIAKKLSGKDLSEAELLLLNDHPSTGRDLLKNIPRLENIAKAISYQLLPFYTSTLNDNPRGEEIPFISRMLHIIVDLDYMLQSGMPTVQAVRELSSTESEYDKRIISILEKNIEKFEVNTVIVDKMIKELRSGMILVADILDDNGLLILPKGVEITNAVNMRLQNFSKFKRIVEPIKVIEPQS